MESSIESFSLNAAFINDVLKNYRDKKDEYVELFDIAPEFDLINSGQSSIKIYNKMCEWIENRLGKFSVVRIRRIYGETTYETMLNSKIITSKHSTLDLMKSLIIVASFAVENPKKRGWEIIKNTDKLIIMRRTQVFNNELQLGLLDGLMKKSGVAGMSVDFCKEVELGTEFDEYIITWI